MTQPQNRFAVIPVRDGLDTEAGEFWVENPFMIASSGHNLSAYEPNRTFINLGGLRFFDASFASGADIDSDSRSVVAADFDRDGAIDLLVASAGGGPLRLFLNRIPDAGNRIHIELVGTQSNRAGIGARVKVHAGDRRIIRDLFPVNSFMGQSPPEMIIGIGQAETIDYLSVRWPNGSTQEFRDVTANQRITITEGQPNYAAQSATFPTDRSSD